MSQSVRVARLYRYPIKGLSGQPLPHVAVTADKPFPYDRTYALARPGSPIDPAEPKWAKKARFCMLMLDEALASAETMLDPDSLRFTALRDGRCLLSADLSDAADRDRLEAFIWSLLPELAARPSLVRSRHGHFMDKPENVISLINLATVRRLEEQWGVAIDPLRFRANIYIDGTEPWAEFGWVGGDLAIGGVPFTVKSRNGRCAATNVNPATGQRDLNIPASLRASFGHKDLGIYLMARGGGTLAVGDSLTAPAATPVDAPAATPVEHGSQDRFICGGCYFIYDESKGLPQQTVAPGTAFRDIPESWLCPDCGAEKSRYRPYGDAGLIV